MLFIYLISGYMPILYLLLIQLHHVHSLFTDEPNKLYCKISIYSKFIMLRFTSELVGVLHGLSEIPMEKMKWKNTYLTYTSHLGSDFQKLIKSGQKYRLCDLSPFSSVSLLSYLVLDSYMKS